VIINRQSSNGVTASGGYWQSDEIFARRKWRPKGKRTRDRRERILFDVKGSKNVPQDFTGAPSVNERERGRERARSRSLARTRLHGHTYYGKIKGRGYSP